MARKIVNKNIGIEEKLEYLGLELNEIPKEFINIKPLKYRVSKFYDEKHYRQYRYLSVKDIQILLSPTNRLDEIEEKYKNARPLKDYLDSESEENILRHTTFLNMLKTFKIEEVEKIQEEQEMLNKKIPFKVKYQYNYLWQIYYSENSDQYFMLVPTEDSDYSTFFYLMKKQIEKKAEKIFVPIRNAGYSEKYLKKSEIEDIENYLWLFTKDWPLVYEVYDKNNKLSIQIVGETEVYPNIKTSYKIKLKDRESAKQFYKLLKAMFILQTETPNYFKFRTNINKTGGIDFYLDDKVFKYEEIAEWINEKYDIGETKEQVARGLIKESSKKIEDLKIEIAQQEIEYLAKEKQISTFLECKKTFFGKFKYYFKYNKKSNKNIGKNKINNKETNKDEGNEKDIKNEVKKKKKQNYTIEELIELYKNLESYENKLRNILMDINSLKLKNKNMKKKIENATAFIEEIDNHKKSIFEFWKYSNKDEIATLPEGEAEEINIVKKITRTFDYENDLEKFGQKMDKMQRKNLNKEETDSIFITTTKVLEILNKIKINDILPKEIENLLKELKREAVKEKTLSDNEEFDIFGGIVQDSTKVSIIKNKTHRELPKDMFNILDINKNTKQLGFKLSLEKISTNIKEALDKVVLPECLPIYKAIADEKIDERQINVFNINPEAEIKNALKNKRGKINFYKINVEEQTNAISYTNCIFYDNQNRTLPIGQDLSTNILIDVAKINLKLKDKTTLKVVNFEDEKDDFSKATLKTINVYEFDSEIKQEENKIEKS